MNASSVFYICPTCFYACEIPDEVMNMRFCAWTQARPVTKGVGPSPIKMDILFPPRPIGSMKRSLRQGSFAELVMRTSRIR